MTPAQYRRHPHLVLYWRDGVPIGRHWDASTRRPLTADVAALLTALDGWTTVEALCAARPELGAAADVARLLEAMADRGMLQRSADVRDDGAWDAWAPDAAFFHFGTRDPQFRHSPAAYDEALRRKAAASPPPPAKSVDGARQPLPRARGTPALTRTLRERRTWRRFASDPLRMADLAALLQLTWGVQRRGAVAGQGEVALKTSPSGGARHSVECYVLNLNVAGVPAGAYHYDAARHELAAVAGTIDREQVGYALADQHYFAAAAAVFVMTAVFARAMWRYPFSRAYRSVLTEAGHLGQTFCLVATARRLAPFCTMAFRDRELEAMLGVDGSRESALYVVGVGARPRGRVAQPGRIPARYRARV